MTAEHKVNIALADEISKALGERVRFLVSCAESLPEGATRRNEFNLCIEEMLHWAVRYSNTYP